MTYPIMSQPLKDTHLGLVVPSALKEALQSVASNEGRSVNSVCNSWLSERIDMERRGNIPESPHAGLPAGFITACQAHGIDREKFFLACARAFVTQTRGKALIAYPPEFLMQDRSNLGYVKDLWKDAGKDGG